jgi:hypothetical protein
MEERMEKLEVVSPAGLEAVRTQGAAPRLPDLNGRTIGEIWNGVFKGDLTFPRIRALLQQRYPGVTIVPYTEFPHAPGSDHPAEQRERAQRLARLAKEQGCDAVISGNGA